MRPVSFYAGCFREEAMGMSSLARMLHQNQRWLLPPELDGEDDNGHGVFGEELQELEQEAIDKIVSYFQACDTPIQQL
jgi:hypothetical protein